jgi:Rrf2 family protein
VVSSRVVAEELGLSPSYLAKLVQALAKAGLAEATRGATGGFAVRGDPKGTSCLDVVLAIDGPAPTRACLFPKPTCRTGGCIFKKLCEEIAGKAAAALAGTSILDLSKSYRNTQ